MNRRSFLQSLALATGAGLASSIPAAPRGALPPAPATESGAEFKLLYAPHFGMFQHHAGKDPIDQLRFMHDQGFRALEDNGMAGRPVELQEKIAAELARLDMTMGVFVAHTSWEGPSFTLKPTDARERIRNDLEKAVEVSKRVNAKWCTVVPGQISKGVPMEYQTANVIDNLRFAAEICEPSGLTMVLEPLNWWTDHYGVFLTGVPQAFEICRAVDSPSCKILDDLYHQQITEGNLIPNLDRAWSEIAYFQVGDNPGRKEPTTGEINYLNIFRHLHQKGFSGVVGMEHGNSKPGKEGERAVIEAYRQVDSF